MNHPSAGFLLITLASVVMVSSDALARDLTFEERVAAQAAIERVYYSHQAGSGKSFEETYPPGSIDKKVQTYLRKSAALQELWHTPVTAAVLQRELERMIRDSRMPARLHEVFQALGSDQLRARECLARPVVVDRMARSFFSMDERIHSSRRAEAESVRARLVSGELSASNPWPLRSVSEVSLEGTEPRPPVVKRERNIPRGELDELPGRQLSPEDFERWRSNQPARVHEVGPVVEGREEFSVHVLLAETTRSVTVATYTIPKISWDEWWKVHETDFDETIARTTALEELPSPSAALTLHIPQAHCVSGDTWDNGILDDIPGARSGHTAVWTGSEMILWGGGNASGRLNSGNRYDPITDSWSSINSTNAPAPRSNAFAAWTGKQMIVWGGNNAGTDLQSGGLYDPSTDSWSSVSVIGAPEARTEFTGVWTGQEMIIWGGRKGSSFLNTGARYDPASNAWSPITMVGAPSPRAQHTGVWTGSRMLIWGGVRVGGLEGTGGSYDPVSNVWTSISSQNAPSPRYLHTAVWTGERMIIWGGSLIPGFVYPSNTGGQYDPINDSWNATATESALPTRQGHLAVWTGAEMIVFGGKTCGQVCAQTNTGSRYDPVSSTWGSTSVTNAPPSSLTDQVTAVWSGALMVVWGGERSSGRRYDPATDSWTPTSMGAGPEPTDEGVSVWTGNLFLVWGGRIGDNQSVGTGARYDPLLDAWTPMNSGNAPAPRWAHTAIWTGSRMVIWGGVPSLGGGGLNTGGQYDPALDQWVATSTANAPPGRSHHSVVWTGSQMIVWGGAAVGGCCYLLNDGGRYDPDTDTWSSMATASRVRTGHVAVWTGNEMIVWGYSSNIGSSYNPGTDTWKDISGTNAPRETTLGQAVWTGEQMIVWGGWDGNFLTKAGGRYDPTLDSWQSTSVSGAPEARQNHTAVWTGTEMIVWGGTAAGGGRYNPVQDSWQSVSADNAPPSSPGHTAAWTGTHMIVWGGADTGGRYAPAPVTQPPVADAGPDLAVECGGPSGTLVTLSGSAVGCGNPGDLIETWQGPFPEGGGTVQGPHPTVTLPMGSSTVSLSVQDGFGQTALDTVQVTVEDTTPPQLSLDLSPALLYPPNHRMVDIGASLTATDACSATRVILTSATSSEPADASGPGDGNTGDDIQGIDLGTADSSFQLRAERDGSGNGRIYEVDYSAVDGAGNTSQARAFVVVPHDLGGVTEPLNLSALEDGAGTFLNWNPVPAAIAYSVIRGNVRSLQVAGDFIDLGTVTCIQSGSSQTSTSGHQDGQVPAVGEAFFYLAAYNDGHDSGFGSASAAKPRIAVAGGCE